VFFDFYFLLAAAAPQQAKKRITVLLSPKAESYKVAHAAALL
jgi:hypothetical protein